MFCPNCGTKNEDGDMFCAQCGTPLKEIDVPEDQEIQGFGEPVQGAAEEDAAWQQGMGPGGEPGWQEQTGDE